MGFLPTLIRITSSLSGCHTTSFTRVPLQLSWDTQWQLCSPCWPEPGAGLEGEGRAGSIVPAQRSCGWSEHICSSAASREASSNLPLSAEHQHSGGNPAYFCCVEFPQAPSALQSAMHSPGWAATPCLVFCTGLHKDSCIPGVQWHINILPPINVPHLSHATLTSVPTQRFQRAWSNESITKTNLICLCMLFVSWNHITYDFIPLLNKTNVVTQKSEHFNANI